jgi:hypothetical protein
MIIELVTFIMRTLLAVVLIAAGAAKLADVPGFAASLKGLAAPLPRQNEKLIKDVAHAFPVVELSLGLLAIAAFWPTLINGAIVLVMSCFTIVTLFAMRTATPVTCRCFGALSDVQFNRTGLLRSIVLTIMALLVFVSGLLAPGSQQPAVSFVTGGALVVAYAIFALATVQAARVVAEIKERMAK